MAAVNRVDRRLCNADIERAARLRVPRIFGVPVPGNGEVGDLTVAAI